ncbi:hypothetical protein CDO43_15900, partial [Pseudomonas aeruginosa]
MFRHPCFDQFGGEYFSGRFLGLSLGDRSCVELRARMHVLQFAMEIKAVPVFTRHLSNGRHLLLRLYHRDCRQ